MAILTLDKHPKVPCCTLLVRIVPAAKSEDGTKNLSQHDTGVEPAQWEDLGLLVPSKGYKDGDYDSVLALPSASEEELYKYRSKQKPITLRDRAEKAKRSAKVDKWDNKTVDDKELIAWVSLLCCCVRAFFYCVVKHRFDAVSCQSLLPVVRRRCLCCCLFAVAFLLLPFCCCRFVVACAVPINKSRCNLSYLSLFDNIMLYLSVW